MAIQTPDEKKHAGFVAQLRATLGPQICAALDDPTVVEVMANPEGVVLVERAGRGIEVLCKTHEQAIVNTLSLVSTFNNGEAGDAIVEGALPVELGGARFEGVLPPCSQSPIYAIRLKARAAPSIQSYADKGIATPAQVSALRDAVLGHKNIVVSGGTGSGKTTLLNALIAVIPESGAGLDERVVTIEDTPELNCTASNYISLLTDTRNDMTRLLKATLRLRPNRILVGEVRDKAALALLKAWNTGHPGGLATLHANNPQAALLRLDQLCQEAGVPSQHLLIEEAVDVVVQIGRHNGPAGRQITAVYDVKSKSDIG